MSIDNEQQAQEAIEAWRVETNRVQLRYLQEATASLEMSAMYYEQKGNDLGAARIGRCLALLQTRRDELLKE
ncbi:MAG: hypothetical protein PHI06_05765 [Desulfobulbaceae bacterium]|nr:hypothetical protein [Desulfobulbaceae bacterium]